LQFQRRPQPDGDSPGRLAPLGPGLRFSADGAPTGPGRSLATATATVFALAPVAIGADHVGRASLPFRAVNRAGSGGHDAGLQRHHLLPRQLLAVRSLSPLFEHLGRTGVGFEDFRRNGLLLPATEQAARILGLPLHRGPHLTYNRMVIDRVGLIESSWSRERGRRGEVALGLVGFRLRLLQQALRRRLLEGGRSRAGRLVLNGRDPALANSAFAELDAMADLLWRDAEAADPGGW